MSMASSRIVGFNTETVTSLVDIGALIEKAERANVVLSQIRTVNRLSSVDGFL